MQSAANTISLTEYAKAAAPMQVRKSSVRTAKRHKALFNACDPGGRTGGVSFVALTAYSGGAIRFNCVPSFRAVGLGSGTPFAFLAVFYG